MKTFVAIILGCFLISSCSNNGPDPSNPPPANTVSGDTLTAGWSLDSVNNTSDFEDIFFANATTGYLCEWGVGISKSTDGGHTWTHIFNNPTCENLAVTPDGKLFFVTGWQENKLYFSFNNGSTIDSVNLGNYGLHDVYFLDNNIGFVTSGSGLYKTVNGGTTWDLLPIPVAGTGPTWAATGTVRLFFLTPDIGWISFGKWLRHTDGSITNWQTSITTFADNQTVSGVFATNANTVYLGDDQGRLYKSIDGGANFSLIHSFPGESLNNVCDLHFIDSNTGYYSFGNKIYKTSDAGASWQTVVTLGRGAEFEEIHFLDAHHGWGCGTNGKIVIYQQ